MTKLEAAARQALEALEIYGEHAKDCPQYPTYTRPQDYPKCDCGYEEAITALREALAEQSYDEAHGISSYHLQETEQAEQEPVAWMYEYQPFDSSMGWFWGCSQYIEDTKSTYDCDVRSVTPLYAAPLAKQDTHAKHVVQQVDPCNPLQDLTDDDIDVLAFKHGCSVETIRAVIAAYKEKNK